MTTLSLLTEVPSFGADMEVRYHGRAPVTVSTVVYGQAWFTRVDGPWGVEHFPGNLSNSMAAARYYGVPVK